MSNPNRIREWRKRKKLTLEQVAEAAGMSPSFLSRIESGERKLTLSQIPRLAQAIGVFEFQLLGLNDGVPVLGELDNDDNVDFYDKDYIYPPFNMPYLPRITRPCSQASDNTAAIYNKGIALGRHLKQWMLYYNSVRSFKINICINRLCVVETSEGKNLVKTVQHGREANRYDLESPVQPTMRDQALRWASPVIGLMPTFVVGDLVHGVDQYDVLPI